MRVSDTKFISTNGAPPRTNQDRSDQESKVATAVSPIFGRTMTSSRSLQVDQITLPVVAQLNDDDLAKAIEVLQLEQLSRAEGRSKIIQEFRDALVGKKWNELASIKQKMERTFSPIDKQQIVNSLSADFQEALVDACPYRNVKTVTLDKLFDVIGKTPVIIEAISALLEIYKNIDVYSKKSYIEALIYLLSKDNSPENEFMVEARSKVMAQILCDGLDIKPFLQTGPVFFLSDGADRFNFRGYEEARRAFIEEFVKARSSDVCIAMESTPHRLPSDAETFFTEWMATRVQISESIRKHLQACEPSDIYSARQGL